MLQIDETTVEDHFSLATSDFCFYIWEYTAGQRYDFSPTNQLIANLKIKPTQITAIFVARCIRSNPLVDLDMRSGP
jgi:hypothetical protein